MGAISGKQEQSDAPAQAPPADAIVKAPAMSACETPRKGVDLIADGLIPTTAILNSVLRSVVGESRVRVRCVEQLTAAQLCDRPLIFSRVCAPHLAWLPKCLAESGARYGYFLDDNFWALSADNEVARYYARPEVRRSLDKFITYAAAVFVPSDLLADEVRRRFDVPVFSLPAPFDFENIQDWPTHGPAFNRALRVGYAGSERGSAFDTVSEAILRILKEHRGDITFEFIGFIPEPLVGCPGVAHFPAQADYKEFLAFKQSRHWDVGLAPLSDDAFCRAKTNNKFREYGALSIAGIYSDVYPYRGCVSDGINGLLVGGTADDWVRALQRMLDDRHACALMGSRARAYVWRHHRLDRVAPEWTAAVTAARLKQVSERRRLYRRWYVRYTLAKLRTRISIYESIRNEAGILALFAHLLRRASEVISQRLP